jgi:hypothetical protein
MSLMAWQGAVLDLVARGREPSSVGLTSSEEAWLRIAASHRGTLVTRAVAISRRAERLARAVPLTLRALRELGLEDRLVAAYQQATSPSSSYLVPEGLQFLDFVERVAVPFPHLSTVLELERAVLVARATPWPDDADRLPYPGCWLERPDHGRAVATAADPNQLVLALVAGQPLPDEGSGRGLVLVGPGIEGHVRVAQPDEERILSAIVGPTPFVEVVLTPRDHATVVQLVAEGVVAHRVPRTSHRSPRPEAARPLGPDRGAAS